MTALALFLIVFLGLAVAVSARALRLLDGR